MSLSGGDAIYGVRLQDDVTSTAKAMSNSVKDLRENLRVLVANSQATRAAMRPLNVGIGEARKMFADAGGNVKLFSAALKDAGVSALDARLLIGKMTTELTASRREALGMDSVWGRMFSPKSIWVASHALSVLQKGWQGVGTAISMAQSAGNTIKENLLDPVVEAAQYRETTLITLRETLMNSGEASDKKTAQKRAVEIFKNAQKLAQETPLDTNEVIDTFNKLQTSNFTSKESELLARLVADQSTLFGAEKGKQTIDALARVKGRGSASNDDLESFRAAGFSTGDIAKKLGERLGIKDKDEMTLIAKVKKKLSGGKVGVYTFLNAAIASKEKGGAIGDVAKANSDSLKGAISNVKSAFSDLLQSTDVSKWHGFVVFKDFLNMITKSLNIGSESGQELLGAVEEIVESIFDGLENITADDLAGWIRHIAVVAREAADGIYQIWKWVDTLLHTEGGIGEGLKDTLIDIGATIGDGILKGMATGVAKSGIGAITYAAGGLLGASDEDTARAKDELLGAVGLGSNDEISLMKNVENVYDNNKKIRDEMVAWGSEVIDPKEAFLGVSAMIENGKNLVKGMDKGVKEEGQIHSPSRVFEEHGRNLVKGLERGVNNQGRTTNLGGRNVEISVEINVMGSTDDPDALANAIRPMLVDVFTSEFERLAAEGG